MKRPGLILFLWVLLLALCAWPFTVRAEGYVAVGAGVAVHYYTPAYGSGSGPTVAAVCSLHASNANQLNDGFSRACQGVTSAPAPDANGNYVNGAYTIRVTAPGGQVVDYPGQVATAVNTGGNGTCPANSSASGGQCLCAVGYSPNAGATACLTAASSSCDILAAAANAAGLNYTVQPALAPGVLTFCNGGCSMTANFAGTSPTGTTFVPPFKYAGSSCTGNGTGSTVAPAPVQCPTGQCPGTFNGTSLCVPCSSSTATGSSTTATPAGAGSAPAGVTAGSESTAITCTGSQCTKVTTIKDGLGNVIATKSDTTPKTTFCQDNPEISICKDSTFSNSCSAGSASISCTGDAVDCAIAREQYTRNCQLFEGQHATRGIAEDALAGVPDPDHPGADGNVSSIAIDQMIDTAPLIGAGSCPADVAYAVPVYGSVVVPWSDMCSWLQLMGTILVAAAGVTWLFIVFGSKGV